jgi:hypothetical protein
VTLLFLPALGCLLPQVRHRLAASLTRVLTARHCRYDIAVIQYDASVSQYGHMGIGLAPVVPPSPPSLSGCLLPDVSTAGYPGDAPFAGEQMVRLLCPAASFRWDCHHWSAFTTCDARAGQSGSPIFTGKNEAIGMVEGEPAIIPTIPPAVPGGIVQTGKPVRVASADDKVIGPIDNTGVQYTDDFANTVTLFRDQFPYLLYWVLTPPRLVIAPDDTPSKAAPPQGPQSASASSSGTPAPTLSTPLTGEGADVFGGLSGSFFAV